MGANCCFLVSTLEEAVKSFEAGAQKAVNDMGLQVDGDACVIDPKNKKVWTYELQEIDKGECGRVFFKAVYINPKNARIPEILPAVAAKYGEEPTEKKPLIAMIRYD
jgi:hypothetical protein